jgi:aminoglycoside phosphotransferase (APT) family kinase protein
VAYRQAAGAPARLFCKLPPTDDRRASIVASMMGYREARFYAEVAPSLPLRVPRAHVALTDESGEFVVLLEDLAADGCLVSDGTWGVPPDAAAGAVAELAAMHVHFATAQRRSAVPWITVNKPSADYAAPMLRHGIDHHRDRLTDAFVAIAELCIDRQPLLQDVWHAGPHTVIHGDAHIGNVFLDGGRVGFLDWGIVNVNTPLREIAYFLTMALDTADRRVHERDLLRLFLDHWNAGSGSPISWDEAWFSYRVQVSYDVQACCQVVTFPEGMSERRRVFSDAFLERAQVALDDLDALGALRRAAGL